MHYIMIKAESDTESGYYFMHDTEDAIKDFLLEKVYLAIESILDIKSVDEFLEQVEDLCEEHDIWYEDAEKLVEGDLEAIEDFDFYIDSARTITECYTDDPNEFLEYLKTIDEDLIEGMDADEAGEAIAKEYTSW